MPSATESRQDIKIHWQRSKHCKARPQISQPWWKFMQMELRWQLMNALRPSTMSIRILEPISMWEIKWDRQRAKENKIMLQTQFHSQTGFVLTKSTGNLLWGTGGKWVSWEKGISSAKWNSSSRSSWYCCCCSEKGDQIIALKPTQISKGTWNSWAIAVIHMLKYLATASDSDVDSIWKSEQSIISDLAVSGVKGLGPVYRHFLFSRPWKQIVQNFRFQHIFLIFGQSESFWVIFGKKLIYKNAKYHKIWFREFGIPIPLFWEEHFKTKIRIIGQLVQILGFFSYKVIFESFLAKIENS